MLYFTNEILYMQGRPWARATPQALGLGQPLTPGQPMGLKKKKKNYIHKRKFLLEDKTNIQRAKKKKKIVINQYTQQTNGSRFYFIFYNKNGLKASKLTNLSYKPTDNQN